MIAAENATERLRRIAYNPDSRFKKLLNEAQDKLTFLKRPETPEQAAQALGYAGPLTTAGLRAVISRCGSQLEEQTRAQMAAQAERMSRMTPQELEAEQALRLR